LFVHERGVQRRKRKIPLSQHEVETMIAKEFASERLVIVRDTFIFSCYTGLAYADIKKLRKEDIFIGIDKFKWIRVPRKKGERHDSFSNIPLLPVAEAVLKKYVNDSYCTASGFALPVRSNQKTNEYLKEIADLCSITKRLTFHLARHTFATTITLANKVPIETVSKMLAHSTIAMTQQYAQ
jgi:integrase